jgi:hypothetical protein
VPASTHEAALFAALKPQAVNGAVGLGTYLRGFIDYLKSLARQAVDTEEERDAIVEAALKVADKLVAPRFPPSLWAITRNVIQAYADAAIDNLPALLEG